MLVFALETSCDETAVALYDSEQGLLAHQLYSQIDLHARYGGVVPELASRDHTRKLIPLTQAILAQANKQVADIDAVAYTSGPGLIGALLVGAMFGRSLAYGLGVPALGIHHMEAHLLAPMLEARQPEFPFLALLVSGGHTMLVQVNALGDYQRLGETLDDAVGEAFDKTAKLLGLPYPGGPELAKLAQGGDSTRYRFPRPMTDRPGLDFSFSGLKTFALNTIQASDQSEADKADIARAFEDAVVDTLIIKSKRALEQTQLSQLVVAGGVSANQHLRQRCQQLMTQRGGEVFFPRAEFCTDNAAMVAYVGCQRLLAGQFDDLAVSVKARWALSSLHSPSLSEHEKQS